MSDLKRTAALDHPLSPVALTPLRRTVAPNPFTGLATPEASDEKKHSADDMKNLLAQINAAAESKLVTELDLRTTPPKTWGNDVVIDTLAAIDGAIYSLEEKNRILRSQYGHFDKDLAKQLSPNFEELLRLKAKLKDHKQRIENDMELNLDDLEPVIAPEVKEVPLETGGVAPDEDVVSKKTATEILADENNDAEEEFKTALNASFPDGEEKKWEFRKDKVAYFLKTAEQHMDALTDKIKRLRKVSKDPSYSQEEHKEFAIRIAALAGTERHISEKRNKIKRQTFLLRAADDKIIRDTEKKYAKELQTADEDARMTIWEYLLMWWRGAERSTSTDAQFFIKIVLFLTILTSWATFFGLILDKKANSNTLSEFQKKHPELNRRGMPAIWAVFITVSFIFSSACILRTKSIIGAFWVFGFWVFVLVATNGVYQNMGG